MKPKIRILFITSGLSAGGKERQLVEIIKFIDKTAFHIGVISFGRGQRYSTVTKDIADYYCEVDKKPNKIKPLFAVWDCFKKFKPDIVHTWDPLSSFYVYLPIKWFKAKFIEGSIRDAGISKGFHFYFKRFYLKRADLVIANSYIGMKNYKASGEVIYNVIDLKRFLPRQESNDFNIVMAANFTAFKDHQTFIDAAIKLLEKKVINKVYLLGDGINMSKWINHIEQNHFHFKENFIFPKNVSNVEEYLSFCKVGVLCSTEKYSEGISNSVLEYMGTGLVPIVTNIGGSNEIIQDGYNGFLINSGGSFEIVELIEKLKSNEPLRNLLIKNALYTIEEKFNAKKNMKKYEEVYEKLIDIKRYCDN